MLILDLRRAISEKLASSREADLKPVLNNSEHVDPSNQINYDTHLKCIRDVLLALVAQCHVFYLTRRFQELPKQAPRSFWNFKLKSFNFTVSNLNAPFEG